MASTEALRDSCRQSQTLRAWLSRAFVVSIVVYLVVVGYLVAESVMGASRWAPYGVNIPLFIALVLSSEIVIILTAAWIFREDSGIWPPGVSQGWTKLRGGLVVEGLKQMVAGGWNVSLVDLRLRTATAIHLGRINRMAALVPLVYALAASAGGAPWGLRGSALVDIGITLAVWAFMELVMVRPAARAGTAPLEGGRAVEASAMPVLAPSAWLSKGLRPLKQSKYEVRRVELGDVERIEEIERIKWKEQAATREMVLSRLRAFPEGQLAAVHITDIDGISVRRAVVAWCTVMPANESQVRAFRSWNEVTANGTIGECDPRGNVLVGVNLTSVTEGAAYVLLGEILAGVVEGGRKKLIGGSRLNGFVSFNARRRSEGKRPFSADEYARLREIRGYRLNEERIDGGLEPLPDEGYKRHVRVLLAENGHAPSSEVDEPDYVCSNLRGYMGIPGAHMVGVVADYFDDSASDNYGVVIEWPNPLPLTLKRVPWLKRWAARRIRQEVRAEWEARKERLRELSERRAAARVPEYLRKEPESRAGSERVGAGPEARDRPVARR